MAEYELTPDAENDLREIARYTTRTWGVAQTRKYKAALVRGLLMAVEIRGILVVVTGPDSGSLSN